MKQRSNRKPGFAALPVGLFMILIATGCAKQVQTLHYIDPDLASIRAGKSAAVEESRSGEEIKRAAASYEAEGDQLMVRGKQEEAMNVYRQALGREGSSVPLHQKMGQIALNLGQPDLAAAHFEEILKTDSDDAAALEGLGVAMLKKQQEAKAEEFLTKALQRNAALPAAQNGLGILSHRQGDHDVAVKFHRAAVRLDPQNPHYQNDLGYSLLLSGNPNEAIDAFKEAVRLAPPFRKAHNNLGIAYGMTGHYDLAFESFRKAIDEAGAYNNLGNVYYQAGLYEEAIAAFQKAIEFKPVWYTKAVKNRDAVRVSRNASTGRLE